MSVCARLCRHVCLRAYVEDGTTLESWFSHSTLDFEA